MKLTAPVGASAELAHQVFKHDFYHQAAGNLMLVLNVTSTYDWSDLNFICCFPLSVNEYQEDGCEYNIRKVVIFRHRVVFLFFLCTRYQVINGFRCSPLLCDWIQQLCIEYCLLCSMFVLLEISKGWKCQRKMDEKVLQITDRWLSGTQLLLAAVGCGWFPNVNPICVFFPAQIISFVVLCWVYKTLHLETWSVCISVTRLCYIKENTHTYTLSAKTFQQFGCIFCWDRHAN